MAITPFQSDVLKLIARSRISNGQTYIAGGLALNHCLKRPRVSEDIDVFNDSYEALIAAADADRKVLSENGLEVETKRERDYIVEALVSRGQDATDIQWVRDSAFRFFPLVEDDLLGLVLHPFDLATNKLLALAGRRVPRDWVDMIACCESIQPLGLLAWAATGKDVGLTPNFILDMAARTTYSQKELDLVVRCEQPLDVAEIARKWHEFIWEAREVVRILPSDQVGKVVMTREGDLFKGTIDELANAIRHDELIYHEGELGGAWPTVVEKS